MRKRLTALAAAVAPIVALTVGVAPAHAQLSGMDAVDFWGSSVAPYCLDVPNQNAVVGQQLTIAACNDSTEQGWNIIYTDSYHFELQSKLNTGLCANDWQGGDVSGNDIKLYYCNGDADGTWNSVHNGTWEMQIQPQSEPLNTCLNIWGGLAPDNPAKLYQCGNVPNEDVLINGVS